MKEVIEIELTDSLVKDIETTNAVCACDWDEDQLLATQRICELVDHGTTLLSLKEMKKIVESLYETCEH